MECESGGEEGDPGEGWDTGSRNEARTHNIPRTKGHMALFSIPETQKRIQEQESWGSALSTEEAGRVEGSPKSEARRKAGVRELAWHHPEGDWELLTADKPGGTFVLKVFFW